MQDHGAVLEADPGHRPAARIVRDERALRLRQVEHAARRLVADPDAAHLRAHPAEFHQDLPSLEARLDRGRGPAAGSGRADEVEALERAVLRLQVAPGLPLPVCDLRRRSAEGLGERSVVPLPSLLQGGQQAPLRAVHFGRRTAGQDLEGILALRRQGHARPARRARFGCHTDLPSRGERVAAPRDVPGGDMVCSDASSSNNSEPVAMSGDIVMFDLAFGELLPYLVSAWLSCSWGSSPCLRARDVGWRG